MRRKICAWYQAALLCFALSVASTQAKISLVDHAEAWRYHKGNAGAIAPDWKTTADTNLDSWLTGNGGFGYSDNSIAEVSQCQTLLSDMRGRYSTVAMRKTFEVAAAPGSELHLMLTVDWDDGFIAWLDGVYLASENSPNPPSEPPLNANATASHESSRGDSSAQPPVTYDLGPIGDRLKPGPHVLAMVGLNSSLNGSSDFVQLADLFLSTNAVASGTCISGLILTNSTWSATNSPVEICGNLTIAAGATLTIGPGTAVYLDSGVNLIVADGGVLLAQGNQTNRIQFLSNPATGTPWGGITVHGSAGSPETRIAYADIQGNGATAIHSDSGTVFLDHLNFFSADRQYISLDASSFIVSDCVFPAGLINFELGHGTGGIKPGGHGLFLRNYFGGTLGYDDVVDFTGGQRPGPIVHFIDNVFTGSQDDGLDLDGTDAWVEGNIFMHVHRNGNTPDSSAGVSGGDYGNDVSHITIVGNLFFDCDNALTAKQGNFYTFINNTVVHTTKEGGIDFGSGVINVRDTTPELTTFASGCYVDGNIIVDAQQLVRNYDAAQTIVTLNDNILPTPWNGPGSGNLVADPLLNHLPQVSEMVFTNWAQAQIVRSWFGLQPGSPAIGTGPNGTDKGGVIPRGASISGEPPNMTTASNATLQVGLNRRGFGIPASAWPEGSGYTHYRWRLHDGTSSTAPGTWSAETPIATPIILTNLSQGPHYVEVTGKLDSGLYQDDPLLGPLAEVTRSRVWTVTSAPKIERISRSGSNSVVLQFAAIANTGYMIEYRDSVATGAWQSLLQLDPVPNTQSVTVTVPAASAGSMRFYRIVKE